MRPFDDKFNKLNEVDHGATMTQRRDFTVQGSDDRGDVDRFCSGHGISEASTAVRWCHGRGRISVSVWDMGDMNNRHLVDLRLL